MSLSADELEATLVTRSKLKTLVFHLSQIVFPDRQFVSILKYELDLVIVSIYSKLSPIEWAKTRTWKRAGNLKINIGNGPFKHPGWINVDCHISLKKDDIVCDLRRKWPLRSSSAKYIFSEHVFEHFGYPAEIGHVLKECHRVLQPGGVLRVIVPDADRYLRAYADDDENFVRQVGGPSATTLSLVNTMMRENGFHRYAYNYSELAAVLQRAGFASVSPSSLGASQYEELNLDLNNGQRDLESLYVEAVK